MKCEACVILARAHHSVVGKLWFIQLNRIFWLLSPKDLFYWFVQCHSFERYACSCGQVCFCVVFFVIWSNGWFIYSIHNLTDSKKCLWKTYPIRKTYIQLVHCPVNLSPLSCLWLFHNFVVLKVLNVFNNWFVLLHNICIKTDRLIVWSLSWQIKSKMVSHWFIRHIFLFTNKSISSISSALFGALVAQSCWLSALTH